MLEVIFEMLAYVFTEYIVLYIARFFQFIGALVFSLFSFFQTSPLEYYRTSDSDHKIVQAWTGLFSTACIIFSLYWFFYH